MTASAREAAIVAVEEAYGLGRWELMAEFHIASVVPGACLDCEAVTDRCEPDMREGWCHECGGQRVVSIVELVLL